MRGVRRRSRGGVVVAALALMSAGLSGCSILSSDDEGEKPIVVGTTDRVSGLDPAAVYDAGSWSLFGNVYQSLLTFTPGSDVPTPDAAKSCGFQDESRQTYACTLRSGLKFTNGHPLTAKDVKFSFDRILRIKAKEGPADLLDTLKSVETEGDSKVTFHLRTSDAVFPAKIASGLGSIVDSRSYPADGIRTGNEADGSGPYRLKRYAPGSTAELVPNEDYRGVNKGTGTPVTVRYYPEPQQLKNAWDKSEIEVATRDMPAAALSALSLGDNDFRVSETASAATRFLVFNLKRTPLKEAAVRRAVASLVDRVAIGRDIHKRTVEPLYSLIPQGVFGHSTSFYDRYPKPDPESARRLLRSAGVTAPVRFTLAFSKGVSTREEAALIKKQLEATGLFQVDARYVEWAEFQKGRARGDYDAYVMGWLADYPDADTFTSPLVGKANNLYSGYANDRVDKLIRDAQRSGRREGSTDAYRDIQKIVAEDVPLVPLWQKKEFMLSKESISGAQYLIDRSGLWRLWRLGRI
ncbi:ABC transporter substrate-binding protein [Streptomyces huiliensis]|uniref:ABC transporter substrate-binding protein n=1 Tax=Streptomyces huiliensis TaxID=2876027 RepID=UPI001CC02DEB|nr:ABC transporter substrate-binding protein [Streptomyces huiliensis]MBZ4320891.1 peptide-binding protein [Streptomyces huiliensis]